MAINYNNIELNGKKAIIGESQLDPSFPVNLLVGFHGADSTPENILIHGNKLSLENTVFLFPEGPVNAGKGLWSWWQDGPRQPDTVLEFIEYVNAVIDSAHKHLNLILSETTITTNLWGFSQGGAASLVYALLGNKPINRVVSICGFLPELPDPSAPIKTAVTFLGIYGSNDGVVPSFLAEFALEEIRSKGHLVTIKETPQGHEITSENLTDLSDFLKSS